MSRVPSSSRLLLPLLVVLLTGLLVVLVTGADGATPAAGTLSTAATKVTWAGGPFTGSNQTGGLAGAPDCTVPMSCDSYALTLDVPAGYGDTNNLVLTVDFSSSTADFDVYLENAAGAVVASGATGGPESVTVAVPAKGTYSVVVVPYMAVGDSYTASAALLPSAAGGGGGGGGGGTGGGTTTTPDPNAAGFADYAAPSAFGGSNDAGEPSIGDDFKTHTVMYQAGLATFAAKFDDSTVPAKATWTDVSASATNGCAVGNTTSLDPILYTDSTTGRTFQSQLTGVDSATCYTDDDGVSWNASTGGGVPSGVDHQTIGGGEYAASAVGPLPTSTYPNAVYYCSQDIATAFCAASNDGGTTFGAGVPTYNLSQCGGLHGHVRVAPDGTAYLPNKNCNGTAALAVSTDGGLSWTVKPIPGTTAGASDPSVATGRDGTVYVGYVGSDGKPGMAVSRDRGDTWTDLQTAGTAYGIKNAVFPTVIAGDDDRAAFAYIGTPTAGDGGATGVFTGVWHLYVDMTYDGGKTWVTSDATPGDPVQRGSICTSGTTCGADRNLLDFIDITHDDHGRVEVGFADGCINACVADATSTAHDAFATIARQTTGKTLYAKYDPTVDPTPTPTVTPTTTSPTATPTTTSPTATPTTTSPTATPTTTSPTATPTTTSPTATPTTTSPTATPTTTSPTATPTTTSPTATPTSTPTSTPTGTPTSTPTSTPTNTPPTAVAAARPRLAYVGQPIMLSGSGSHDAESPRGTLTYAWDFGNQGRTLDATGEQVTARYTKRGYRTVTLAVSDPQGLVDTTTVDVQIARKVSCESTMIHRRGPWRVAKLRKADRGTYCDNRGHREKHRKGRPRRPDTMTLAFSGRAISIQYATRVHGGSARLYVDGHPAGTIDFGGITRRPAFGQDKVIYGLAKRNHTLQLVFRGKAYLDTFVF